LEAKNKLNEFLDVKPEKTPLEDGYTLEVIPKRTVYIYIFRNQEGKETFNYRHSGNPLSLTEMSTVGKEIKKHMDTKDQYGGALSKETLSAKFEEIKLVLNSQCDAYKTALENEQQMEDELNDEELQARKEEAQLVLESKDMPLIYIACLVSWMTAGERNNIMLTFMAYCSQVILNNPISVIGLGEGSSGKTHIQDVALSLIHDDFIRHEKGSTSSTTFNRAKDDPYYYQHCIVNFGDLGGKNSQDFIMEAKNILKELQSDGFVKHPLNIPSKDEGWVLIDLVLYGNPCLTYTTVPGFKFDDQEMSRSIFITPRTDNRKVFNARKQIMELKHGRTYKEYKKYEKDIEIVKYMVYLLRERMENLTIINPYTKSVIDFLGKSEYFKRDFDKYNGILKTITAFNSFNRQTFEMDGEEILFTSLNDIQIFISLLEKYHESIKVNISPKAAEILNDIRDNLPKWKENNNVSLLGITTTNYFELGNCNLSSRSITSYFKELKEVGFLRDTGSKEGNAVIYAVMGDFGKDKEDYLQLDEKQKEMIRWELGEGALHFIELDVATERLGIGWQDPDIHRPAWEVYDEP
jgi:hypothetical protein